MGSNSIRASDGGPAQDRQPHVIGNLQAPEGKLIVMRVEAASGAPKSEAGELGRFKINGAAYAIRREQRADGMGGSDFAQTLTGRELEVAALVAAGRGNKQIAAKLRISEHTVSSYLNRIYSKLGVHNRSAVAAQYAAWASSLPAI